MSDRPPPQAGPTRILCYSPYTKWELHGLWETTILHGLKLRGADVRYVLCDGLYAECDVFWAATEPRHARSCSECQAQVAELMHRMAMDYEWLGRYTLPAELAAAREWARSLEICELPHATHGDWPVGEWVRGSVHSHFRLSQLDLADERVARAYRGYVESGLIAAFGISRLLDDYRPDVLLQFNGRQSSTRVALELARARDIRVIAHERGWQRESIGLAENVGCTSLEPIRRSWSEWKHVPLTAGELERTRARLEERQRGVNLNWTAFSPEPQPVDAVRAALGLAAERPAIVLFTSSDDELAAEDDWRGAMPSQLDWIDRTVAFAASRPDVDLVIRVHPNSGGRKATGRNEDLLKAFAELEMRLPPNVRLVRADDEISSYTLVALCGLGLVWHSSLALDLALEGKRALVASGCIVSGTGFVHDVVDDAAYESLLGELLAAGRLPVEQQALAYRWAHTAYWRRDLPFPLVQMPDPHTGRLRYSTLDELAPGRSAKFDRICRIVMDGEPVVPPPGPSELARTTEAEEAFFRRAAAQVPPPRVSVVIPCHDYGRYLREAVESVLAQPVPLELVIVDDGSTDDSLAVAEELAAGDPRVQVLAQPCSGQPAIARNNGIAHASAPFVVCLDADDVLAPGYLRALLDALERDPDVGVAYGDTQCFGAETTLHAHPDYDFRRLTHANFIDTAAMFRREAWLATGGYAANVRGYEDWDFWIACGEHGFPGRHVAGATHLYRVGHAGLYADAQARDAWLKAQIVINHPRLYTSGERAWALAVQAGEPVDPGPLEQIPVVAPPVLAPAGRLVVAASTEELAADPELLDRYDRCAAPTDTLLLHVESTEALEAIAAHAERIAADVTAAPEATEADVALQAHAVLTRGRPGPLLRHLPPFRLVEAA